MQTWMDCFDERGFQMLQLSMVSLFLDCDISWWALCWTQKRLRYLNHNVRSLCTFIVRNRQKKHLSSKSKWTNPRQEFDFKCSALHGWMDVRVTKLASDTMYLCNGYKNPKFCAVMRHVNI